MSHSEFLDPPTRIALDAMPVRETSLEQINLATVAEHLAQAKARDRYVGSDDPMEYLYTRRCVVQIGDTSYLTLTGLLCFGRRPQAIFPNAVVDLGHYHGQEAIMPEFTHLEKDMSGTVFAQLTRIEEYLWKNTHHGMTLSETSLARVEVHEYPRAVIRELSVNMIAHRDYALYTSVARVQLFRDRIEWISPGNLPHGVTVKNLLTEQRPRNPNLMRVLYDAGYVEAFGQGLDTVVAVLREAGMERPVFNDTGASFIVTVYGDNYQTQRQDDGTAELSESQRVIYQFIRRKGRVTPREIRDLLAERAERSVQRDIRVLLDTGKIEAVGGTRSLRYQLPEG